MRMTKRMNWEKLLSSKRVAEVAGCASPTLKRSQFIDPRSSFERDYDQIVYSYPFRRLQDKTQVIPFPKYDFVHNRLTHSIEVASVGRSLGKMAAMLIFEELRKERVAELNLYKNDIGTLVATACLAHDIGNPPFGHSGEEAISHYFIVDDNGAFRPSFEGYYFPDEPTFRTDGSNIISLMYGEIEREISDREAIFTETKMWNDLTHFEGNANGFRIITKNCEKGINPTLALIGTFSKYPRESWLTCEIDGNKLDGKSQSKYGFFQDQRILFNNIAQELGLIKVEGLGECDIAYKRHPLAFLMEAADDIANNIIDFEDACRLKLIDINKHYDIADASPKDILTSIALYDEGFDNSRLEQCKDDNEVISLLRAKIINVMTHCAFKVFKDNYEDIMQGKFDESLVDRIDNSTIKDNLKHIKNLICDNVFNYSPVLETEASGFEVMAELIGSFGASCNICISCGQKLTKKELKLQSLLPKEYKPDDEKMAGELLFEERYTRILKIIDYVSGMTDNYASSLYRKIKGISLPRA
jgi:dGTPase